VTAVIVAHDGATWLPHVIDALLGQTRPVQRVVAVDTGSRDRSGSVLAGKLGRAVVFGMDRGTGYGAAVARAVQHQAATASLPGAAGKPRSERTEWLWLLHDDCEPAPDALEQLLRGAAETRAAAVLGPKVKDWADRDVILEAGVTIDTVGRRITGIEPREVDQGQHDGDRDALAVGSAGMLIRRDVWDQVGGFDTSMALFREDVDFCWRVHAAGHRVRVITDAVVYHAQASTKNRRPVSVGRRPRLLDRRNAMITLLGNLPARPMLASLAGNVTVSMLRTLFFLVAKRPAAALDEAAAVASVLGHPLRLLRARSRRARGRRPAYGRVRADLPPGRSVRRMAEFAAAAMSRSAQLDTTGSHHATDDPAEDDFLLTDTGLAQRILTSPSVLLLVGLTVIAIVAEHSLFGTGPLGGGGLVPAWGGTSSLWGEYLQGFHPAGIGSSSSFPPYVAVIAVLGTLLGGKPWLAVDVIMLGCVPLAGLCAYLAARRVTQLALIRVWAAATYALLPVAMGTIAAGRIGTAAVFVLIPLIALLAGRIFAQPRRRARRAAWATGLALTVGTAFVPLLWPIALIAAAAAALAFRRARPGAPRNLGIAVVLPPLLLLPWSLQVFAHPSSALLEAGVQQPGLASADLPARSLLLLSPGGPGLPPVWITAGLLLAALAAAMTSRRRGVVLAGWGVAVFGLAVAIAVSRASVALANGGGTIAVWPGPELAIVAAGLLLAACAAGDSLTRLTAGRSRGLGRLASLRGAWVTALALVACSAPVLAAVFWIMSGVRGPVSPVSSQTVPEFVVVSARNNLQLRTLVLSGSGGQVSYSLLRGSSLSLADPDLIPDPAGQQALNSAVATLVAPGGTEAADQGQLLAQFDIGFVLLRAPVDRGLVRILDDVPGIRQVSRTSGFVLWRLISLPARVQVVEPDGTVVPVPSGPVAVSGAAAPRTGGILELAEPAGGWSATLNGHPLTPVASPAGRWAQAFRLPSGGGTLSIGRGGLGHGTIVILEALALLVVAALALPGIRTEAEQEAETTGADAVITDLAGEQDSGREAPRRRDRTRSGAGAGVSPGGRRDRPSRRSGKIADRAAGLQRRLPAALPRPGPAPHRLGSSRQAPDPGTYAPEPGMYAPEPGTHAPEPGTHAPEPGTHAPEPGTHAPEPGTYAPEPGRHGSRSRPRRPDRRTHAPQPGRYAPQAEPNVPEPRRSASEPGTYPPDPGTYAPEPVASAAEREPYLSAPGRYPPEPGAYAPEPGRAAAAPEPYQPEPGRYASEAGSYPADPEPYLPGPRRLAAEPGRYGTEPGRVPDRAAHATEAGQYPPEPEPGRPAARRHAAEPGPYLPEPGRYAPEPGTYAPEPAYAWPQSDEAAGPAMAGKSPSGAWPPPDEPPGWQPSARQPGWRPDQGGGRQISADQAGWRSDQGGGWQTSADQAGWRSDQGGGWQTSADQAGWRSDQGGGWQTSADQAGWRSDQGGGWQTSADQPDWPPGGDDMLEPLPPAAGTRPGWPEPDADDAAAPRWPAPDHQTEGENW
jgi:GT2 family glycosyltransferase